MTAQLRILWTLTGTVTLTAIGFLYLIARGI